MGLVMRTNHQILRQLHLHLRLQAVAREVKDKKAVIRQHQRRREVMVEAVALMMESAKVE
jgi:hypothetical protein